MNTNGRWEQRWHPLRREWVIVSAHRNDRPWDGKPVPVIPTAPPYDPSCYLCPGNSRVQGHVNPAYQDVFIFDNDLPVVGENAPMVPEEPPDSPYRRSRATGLSRVICYDPRHNVTLTDIPPAKAVRVFKAWRDQTREMAEHSSIQSAFFFENKGGVVGASNPHPHCQLYALNYNFKHLEMELEAVGVFKRETKGDLFAGILDSESKAVRVVADNDAAIAFVPFFARWAYEVWIFPKKRHATLATMSDRELECLCGAFQEVTRRYDLLYDMVFPYVMNLVQAPLKGGPYPDYHLHLVLQPPFRRPGLQKFMAGAEIGGGNFTADTLPEEKAAELQAVDLSKFKEAP